MGKKRPYTFILLADIHWGKTDASLYYDELSHAVLEPLSALPKIDALFIAGDYWDRILSMHHKAANKGILFMQDLMALCKKHQAKLRIIKGTQSHDNSMLLWFELMNRKEENPIDLHIAYTAEEELLYPNLRVLYLPEEYITSYDEHYASFLQKDRYQLIVGHGLLDKASFQASKQESEITHPNAPSHKVNDLLMINEGPSFFGHIHTRTVFQERVHYIGSISRFAHGEEEAKGFYILHYNSPSSYELQYVENTYAPIYRTYHYMISSKEQAETLLSRLKEEVRMEEEDYTRIKISLQEGVELDKATILTLQHQYGGKSHRKLLIENHTKAQQEKMKEEKMKQFVEEYGFLFDQRETHEKILTFITKKKNRSFDPQRAKQILYEKYLRS